MGLEEAKGSDGRWVEADLTHHLEIYITFAN